MQQTKEIDTIKRMQLKKGVKVQDIKPEIILALMLIKPIASDFEIDLVATSCREGQHSINSKHKLGYAVDIRIRELSQQDKSLFTQAIRNALTDEYFVLLEEDHLHIQFNGNFL